MEEQIHFLLISSQKQKHIRHHVGDREDEKLQTRKRRDEMKQSVEFICRHISAVFCWLSELTFLLPVACRSRRRQTTLTRLDGVFFFLWVFLIISKAHSSAIREICHRSIIRENVGKFMTQVSLGRTKSESQLSTKCVMWTFWSDDVKNIIKKRLHGLAQNGGAHLNKFYTQISFFFFEKTET